MGVDLGEVVQKEEIGFDSLKGRILGIDSFNIIYQFLSTIRSRDGSPLMDSRGRITSHLTGLLYRTVNLVEKDIKPVFVFDGKPSELKEKTREERHRIRTEARKKYEKAQKEGKLEEARRYGQQAVSLSKEMVSESKKLAELMGFPVVQAPGEGEAQVSFMCAKGDVHACVSQDYDPLLFGSPLLLRNLTVTGRKKVPGKDLYIEVKPEKIELEKTLSALGIDRKKLVWVAMLIGTDFNEKFPGIGPKTALKLVKEHASFGDIIAKTKHKPGFDYREIEKIFLEPRHTEDYSLEFGAPHSEELKKFLCDERDFSRERVEKAIERITLKAEQKGVQARLDSWE